MKNGIQFEPVLSNFLDESFSNANNTVGAVAEGVGALANTALQFKNDGAKTTAKKEAKALKIAIKAQCGRKKIFGSKKYKQCAKEVSDKASSALALDKNEERKLKLEQIKASSDEVKANLEIQRNKLESENKILGIQKSTFFVGLAAISIAGFLLLRYKIKSK